LEKLGMVGRIILKWFLKEKVEDMTCWIHVTQDLDQWRTLVYKAIKFYILDLINLRQ
jgi:hypothetical protein